MPVAPVATEIADRCRDLIELGLELLQADHVRLLAADELGELLVTRPDPVDVPCGDLHGGGLSTPCITLSITADGRAPSGRVSAARGRRRFCKRPARRQHADWETCTCANCSCCWFSSSSRRLCSPRTTPGATAGAAVIRTAMTTAARTPSSSPRLSAIAGEAHSTRTQVCSTRTPTWRAPPTTASTSASQSGAISSWRFWSTARALA